MKKIKSAVVTFSLKMDYTESVQQMLEDGVSIEEIKEDVLQGAYDSFCLGDADVKFVIK